MPRPRKKAADLTTEEALAQHLPENGRNSGEEGSCKG